MSALAVGLAPEAKAAAAPLVLELFTSQGCSSCPPADALLGELSRRHDVIALAWHVDYWNSLGWKDPYASRQSSDRQRAYASRLHDEVYTPALVVNGERIVVGSSRASVSEAMRGASTLAVSVSLTRGDGGYIAELGPHEGTVSVLAVVYDAEQTTSVRAGENAGRGLKEYRIVRQATTLAPFTGRARLPAVAMGQGVVVLVQDAASRMVGAGDTRTVSS